MNDIFFLHPDFSLWLCLTLLHSLWIWTVIALFVFTADWFMKRVRVEKRYGFHLVALLIGLASLPLTFYYVMLRTTPVNSTVTLITAPRSTPVPTVTPAEKPGDHTFTPALPATAPAPDIQSKETAQRFSPLPEQQAGSFISQWHWNRYLPWIAGGYLLGVSIMLFRLLRSMLQVNRLSSRAIQITEGPLIEIVSTLASRWSLKLAPRIAETKELIVPTVVGLFRPLILLPTSMLSGLTPAELELILTHELAHIRRWDMWINLLQRLAETILFFNPGLWYVNRKINLLREFCCDEMTCNYEPCDQHAQRVNYASALLRVLELAHPQHPQTADLASLAVSGASPSEVRRRVARLFGEPLSEPFRLSRVLICISLTLLLCSISTIWAIQTDPGQTGSANLSSGNTAQSIENRKPENRTEPLEEKSSFTSEKNRPKQSMERVKVSGNILLEDGSPVESKGLLLHRSPGVYGTVGYFTDTFEDLFPEGPLVLFYHPEQYAPVSLDVGALKAGVSRNDLKMILKPGHAHQLKIHNVQGKPIPGATIVIHPNWGGSAGGPNYPLQSDEQGNVQLIHLADTAYDVKVSAPGYEPSQSKKLPVKADGTSTIILKASQKTTGRILDETGQPVAGVKLYLKHQFGGQPPNAYSGSGRGTYWGSPLTKTDQTGRYELTEMTTDAQYLFVLEAPDGRRGIIQNIQAGQDQEFVIPDRRDLRITFSKEVIEKYSIKNDSKVAVRQRVICEPEDKSRYIELIGADVPIKVTESGGTALFPGLAIDLDPSGKPQKVEVILQYHKGPRQEVQINPNGVTQVNFELAQRDSTNEETTDAQPAIEKFPVVIAEHLMLLNGRQPITWDELNTKFAELKNPSQVQPTFYITRGAMAARRMEEFLKFRSRVSRKGFQFHGFSQGSLSARADYYYDHIQTEADLQPDPADKLTGRIVDLNGKPVTDAEVVLITSVPESISYKTYEMALVQGRIRNPLEHRMTRSNSQGEFTLYPPAGEKYYIMALHPEQGFKFDSNESFASQNEIKLLHWSGLKVNLAKVPEETQTVNLSTRVDARAGWPEISINQYWSDLPVEAQKQQFAYHYIPPINQTLISRVFQNEKGGSIGLAGVSVSLLPEEVREISLGSLSKQQSQQLEWIRNRSSSRK
ncbi:MAG: M56 family metallopeptidase [Gimesia chilikensis]|uniref:M56 family metallopeptidase n=1 Tax=Gimesia chilikensis TaxID=2605989 RepID=UPI0037A8AA74